MSKKSDNYDYEFWLKQHYPTTIVAYRYTGVYSGGKYTCWPLDFWNLPDGIEGGDGECDEFWSKCDKSKVGIGNTPQEAFDDLERKLNDLCNKEHGLDYSFPDYMAFIQSVSPNIRYETAYRRAEKLLDICEECGITLKDFKKVEA